MRRNWIYVVACAAALSVLAVDAGAQSRRGRGENGLVGVKLFDSGMRLLQLYGNPDEILPIGAGSTRGGGGGGPARQPGTAAPPSDDPRTGGPGLATHFGDEILRQQFGGLAPGQEPTDARQMGQGDDVPAGPGRPRAGGGGGGGGGRRAAPPNTGQFIRWIYRRNGSQYGFIIDRQNRIVQIEAIGLQNRKVRTKRGIGFGDTFKEVMARYQVPEAYQINGDSIVMQYLVRDRVAFRLNRLGEDKPHVVTAIVVAAGKT